MNRIYRSVWNDKTGTFVAVGENTRRQGKATASGSGALVGSTGLALKALGVALLLAFGEPVWALPSGGVVSAGGASIVSTPGSTTITQSSQNVAINWQSFNIGAGEAVRFIQPNANAIALNRVLGADPSSLLGSLSANGKVFLVNPNGILFGRGASVNVGGLVASTLAISDSDFMAGRYNFTGSGNGAVVNQGSINADGGYVALLGAQVSNEGVITARLGSVVLAAGTAMTLDVAGDGLLNVLVNQGAVNALVENGGLIQADGGQVLLTARAAGGLLQGGVNNTGVIQAQSVENHNGSIRLMGDMLTGTTNVGGTLDASAPRGGNGGFIETSAARVKVADSAVITAHAAQGNNGTWLIDPTDFTIASTGGDMTGLLLSHNLLASNITISSNNGLLGMAGDIHVNTEVHWAGATTLTLDAVHDVRVDAPITSDTAGARLVLTAGHDVLLTAPLLSVAAGAAIVVNASNDARLGGAITGTAANSTITIIAGQNVLTTAPIKTIAADSVISLQAGTDIQIGGAMSGVAANTSIRLRAGQDVGATAAIAVGAADSVINMTAGRNISTAVTAAISAAAATSSIAMNAGHNITINAAVAASAAGSKISLLAGLDGSGPGLVGGTVILVGAVASPDISIRFNPDGYARTSLEIALYPALADAKAWLFLQGSNKTYDGSSQANLVFKGTPSEGGAVSLLPGTASFASRDAGSGKTISFSGFGLGGADAGKFALFSASGTTTATVTKRVLGVSALGANKVYDGKVGDTVTLADNRVAGDILSLSYTAASFADPNAGNGKVVLVSGIGLGGADAANYSVAPALATSANIWAAPLTITAADATKLYGQSPSLSGFTSAGLVNGESIGAVTETSLGTGSGASVLGGPYVITASGARGGSFAAANYSIRYVQGAMTVTQAPLAITAANATKYYGQTMLLTAFTMTGLMNGETINALTETSPGTAANAHVATYVITPGTASGGTFTASNYGITYINGSLSVLPLLIAVPLTPPALTTASGLNATPGGAPALALAVTPAVLLDGTTLESGAPIQAAPKP